MTPPVGYLGLRFISTISAVLPRVEWFKEGLPQVCAHDNNLVPRPWNQHPRLYLFYQIPEPTPRQSLSPGWPVNSLYVYTYEYPAACTSPYILSFTLLSSSPVTASSDAGAASKNTSLNQTW